MVDTKLRTLCAEIDRHQHFSPELWERLRSLGITGIPFGPEHGGAGGTFSDYVVAIEELARAGILAANLPGVSVQVASVLLRYGSAEQIERYVRPVVQGDMIAAWAFTEPATGSDPKQIRTTATKTDEHTWTLNGTKTFISLAAQAEVALVFARTGERLSAFLVDTSHPGWQPGPAPELMAGGGAGTCGVYLDELPAVRDGLVGELGHGFEVMLAVEAEAKVAAAATCVGVAERALEIGAAYALQRTYRGEPIGRRFPSIQLLLGDMGASIDAARAHVYHVARLVTSSDAEVPRHAASARLVSARTVREVTSNLMQICGAYGFTREFGAERLYREGKFFDVLQGVAEIQRIIVARSVLAGAGHGTLG
jgi:alkylation response protein AidB-like acyl-CoA dehydrogenase